MMYVRNCRFSYLTVLQDKSFAAFVFFLFSKMRIEPVNSYYFIGFLDENFSRKIDHGKQLNVFSVSSENFPTSFLMQQPPAQPKEPASEDLQ